MQEKIKTGGNPLIIDYLCDPSKRMDMTVWRMAFKYTMRDDDLYRRTADGILLK